MTSLRTNLWNAKLKEAEVLSVDILKCVMASLVCWAGQLAQRVACRAFVRNFTHIPNIRQYTPPLSPTAFYIHIAQLRLSRMDLDLIMLEDRISLNYYPREMEIVI